jgi:hypothetical protein
MKETGLRTLLSERSECGDKRHNTTNEQPQLNPADGAVHEVTSGGARHLNALCTGNLL